MEYIVWNDIELAAAVGKVNPGDSVRLRQGIYRNALEFKRGGEACRPVMVAAYPGETPIIDLGGQPYQRGQWVLSAPYISLYGLRLQNGSCLRSMATGHHCEYRSLRISGMWDQGLSILGPDSTVEDCEILLTGGQTNTIPSGTTYSNQNHCLYVSADRCTVRRNTLAFAVSGCALHVYGTPTPKDCVFEDNVIYDSGGVSAAVLLHGDRHVFRRNRIVSSGLSSYGLSLCPTSHDLLIEDNTVESLSIALLSRYASVGMPVSATVRRNTFCGKLDCPDVTFQNDVLKDNTWLPAAIRATWPNIELST